MPDLRSWLLLSAVPGVGGHRFQTLLARFGSPEAVLSASTAELMTVPGLGEHTAAAIQTYRDVGFAERQMRLAEQHKVRLVTLQDPDYPPRLRQIFDPPPILYMRGAYTEPDQQAVAVVGTRYTTLYGRQMAERFSAALCGYGLTIVSGLARGVDTIAHHTALTRQGRTIAVLGSGLDKPYPPENRPLLEGITASGAVISEQPFGTEPDGVNFPQRNRIISGMSLGVIVVEAGETSGALITARYALEHNREVFAVPGPLTAPTSTGANRLIKEGTAKLIQTVDDIVAELAPALGLPPPESERTAPASPRQLALPPEEDRLYAALSENPQHIDHIATALSITTSQALSILLSLELKEAVRQLPGKRFVRA